MPTKSESKLLERNPQWKGDEVGYNALHAWIKRRLEKPEKCEQCGNSGFIELSCLDHSYTRDLGRWKYLCRSCHSALDAKIVNITDHRKSKFCECGQEIISNRQYCEECSRQRRLDWWKSYNFKRGRTKGYARSGRPRKEQEVSPLC